MTRTKQGLLFLPLPLIAVAAGFLDPFDTSQPLPIHQVTPPGAAIAARNGEWTTFEKVVGHFSKGDLFCVSNETSTGFQGKVFYRHDGDDVLWKTPNDGTFIPAKEPGSCGAIVGSHDNYVQMESTTADGNRETLYVLGLTFVVLLDGAAWIAWKRGGAPQRSSEAIPDEDESKRVTPISPAIAARLFPGFAVPEGDILVVNGELHRINSGGESVSLKKWSFQESGEWCKIKRRIGNRIIVEDMTYSERFVRYDKHFFRISAWAIAGVMLLLAGVYFINSGIPLAGNIIAGFLIVGSVGCFMPLMELPRYTVGPEPLKRLPSNDFGREVGSAAPAGPSSAPDYQIPL